MATRQRMRHLMLRSLAVMTIAAALMTPLLPTAGASTPQQVKRAATTAARFAYMNQGLTARTAKLHLVGAKPSDVSIRGVSFSRAHGLLTVRVKVNRLTGVYEVVRWNNILINQPTQGNSWGRAGIGGLGLTVGAHHALMRQVDTAPVKAIPNVQCHRSRRPLPACFNFATNTYVFTVPLAHLSIAGYHVKRGDSVWITGFSILYVWHEPVNREGVWMSAASSPGLTFKY